jgi:hypothetical protein
MNRTIIVCFACHIDCCVPLLCADLAGCREAAKGSAKIRKGAPAQVEFGAN